MKNFFEIAVIGGGPAGITAAVQASRYGADVAIFERGRLGGLIRYANMIENFPGLYGKSGGAAAEEFASHAKLNGVRIVGEEVRMIRRSPADNKFEIETPEGTWRAMSVIFAAGTKPRKISAPGLDSEILYSVESPEDFSGKSVAIVGGGDAAFDQALRVSKFAGSITILARGKIHALPLLVDRCAATGIRFYENAEIQSARRAGSAYVLRTSCGLPPVEITADAIVAFPGREPNTDALSPEMRQEIFGSGEFLSVRAAIPGLYFAGDIIAGRHRQLAIAVGTGMLAALEAVVYVKRKEAEH